MNATPPQAPTTPHARSAVNGMIIPLLPHQGGILHRFGQPENRLVIASTSEPAEEAGRLVLEAPEDPALTRALEANKAMQEQMAAQAAQLASMQEQMAALLAAQQAPAPALRVRTKHQAESETALVAPPPVPPVALTPPAAATPVAPPTL